MVGNPAAAATAAVFNIGWVANGDIPAGVVISVVAETLLALDGAPITLTSLLLLPLLGLLLCDLLPLGDDTSLCFFGCLEFLFSWYLWVNIICWIETLDELLSACDFVEVSTPAGT